MLISQSRPRNLKWFHAGPLLFGDWGTSRLYVLGLAFFYTAHASAFYLAAMSVIMAGVAWAYTIICRNFEDGGGVYAVARRIHPTLAIFGATLLLCDYIVTASLSLLDGMHYFGVPHEQHVLAVVLCVAAIGFIGFINWYGAQSAGRFALIIAIAAIATSSFIALLCVPFVRIGLSTISWGHESVSSAGERWSSLVRIVLALSGVEAVANMTGLMKHPVARTAKRTIWPVLIEVVLLNMIFGVALSGLPTLVDREKPDYVTYQVEPIEAAKASGTAAPSDAALADQTPPVVKEYRDTAVKVIAVSAAERFGGPGFGKVMGIISGVVFGLLLISAGNTAIMAIVSVLYSMGQDRELPRATTKLNYSGVPWTGLIIACVAPAVLLVIMNDVGQLADLYAVGVCGAVTISVLGCALNRELKMSRFERGGLTAVGTLMLAIEITILVTKPHATIFALTVIGTTLAVRLVYLKTRAPERTLEEPEKGWLSAVRAAPMRLEPGKARIMLAARGQDQAEFAVDLARRRGAILFSMYVRTIRVLDVSPGQTPRIEDDKDAQESLGTIAVLARQNGVPFFPIYVCSPDIAEEILDYTVTFGCDTLILGKTRRKAIARAIEGDVVSKIAAHLPSNVALLARDASPDGTHTTEAVPHGPDEVPAPGLEVASDHTSGAASPPGENGQRGQASPSRDKPAS